MRQSPRDIEKKLSRNTYLTKEMKESKFARENQASNTSILPEASEETEAEVLRIFKEVRQIITSEKGISSQRELDEYERKLDTAAAVSQNPRLVEQLRKELRHRFFGS